MKSSINQVLRTVEPHNRRSNHRFEIKMPLRYRRSETVQQSEWTGGATLDMSASGLLIDIPERLPIGGKAQIVIDWTGLYHGRPMVRLFLTASVIRVDRRGTALRILNHQFRDVFASDVPLQQPRSGFFLGATRRWEQPAVRKRRAIA